MALNLSKMKPTEIVRVMNSTELGTVLNARQFIAISSKVAIESRVETIVGVLTSIATSLGLSISITHLQRTRSLMRLFVRMRRGDRLRSL